MYWDAHFHLHDIRLTPFREEILRELPDLGVAGGIVNGTREEDWDAVADLCTAHPFLRPAFGLHPWYVPHRTENWEAALTAMLDRFPQASLGETGLDCWIEGHDIEDQQRVFIRQLEIARERRLAVTVHCLKAHEPLRQVLQKHRAPDRGFLLHAYAGPPETAAFFLERGACFSFPAYFLHPKRERQREFFAALPADRVLVETDAPDLLPPAAPEFRVLNSPDSEKPLNHPANLVPAYAALAALRGETLDQLAATVETNWNRLFR